MTSLPTAATVDHLARDLADAEAAVKEACAAYAACRISTREYRETRERRDALRETYRVTVRAEMERSAEGREELAAADALFQRTLDAGWKVL